LSLAYIEALKLSLKRDFPVIYEQIRLSEFLV
jgi:hypothetical protein